MKYSLWYTNVILFSKINYTYKCLEYSIYLVQECRDEIVKILFFSMIDYTCR